MSCPGDLIQTCGSFATLQHPLNCEGALTAGRRLRLRSPDMPMWTWNRAPMLDPVGTMRSCDAPRQVIRRRWPRSSGIGV